ncbi:TolB family protein [Fictibacillus nanhaiensis]|uniref:TolB family protein n=1 Tax=Fictibacillus nanhaiensis TaxID=742169 RepID=UPI003C1B9B12
MKRFLLFGLIFISMIISHSNFAEASDRRAAFIRNDGLWLKEGEIERKLVEGSNLSHPTFSSNGTYISYIARKGKELWVYNRVTRLKRKVFDGDLSLTRWSPTESKLAWKSGGVLNVIDLSRPASSFKNVILGTGNYSWAPDGRGFVVSSSANLEPDGWSPVRLFYVPVNANGELNKVQNITTLPKMSETFFAIGTTEFKWGMDDQWFAFIACPTASMSADSNTLMVVSLDGSRTRMIGNMLDQPNWFQWSPNTKQLGFIKGIGRLTSENKRLTVWNPKSGKEINLSYTGYADGDFTWLNDENIIVSRQIEWGYGVPQEKRAKPFLVSVRIKDGSAKRLTNPARGETDVYPKTLPGEQLTWIRTNSQSAKVMVKEALDAPETLWINNLHTPENCSRWSCMLDIYEAR